MPTSSYRSSCPIIRVPLVPANKKYIRCPECDKKWPTPDVVEHDSSSDTDNSLASIRTPRRPNRRRAGGLPGGSSGRTYPPRHDCSGHDADQDPQSEPDWSKPNPAERAQGRSMSPSRIPTQGSRNIAPNETYSLLHSSEESDGCCQGSLTHWDEPCCSRRSSMWDKIRHMFKHKERYDSPLKITDGDVKKNKKKYRRRRKRSSVTWSRTPSVVYS